jgi:hypothetical protein
MTTFVTVEIYPPGSIFTQDLDPLIMWMHTNVTIVGSAAATILLENFSDVRVMANPFTNVGVKATILITWGVID